GSRFGLEDFGRVGHWRIVVQDHGSGDAGVVRAARILIAARTSPAALDTDLDGVAEGLERSAVGTIPVLPDMDADGLPDGVEIAPRSVAFTIGGMSSVRTVRTNPIDFDTDDDGLPDGPELFPVDVRTPSMVSPSHGTSSHPQFPGTRTGTAFETSRNGTDCRCTDSSRILPTRTRTMKASRISTR